METINANASTNAIHMHTGKSPIYIQSNGNAAANANTEQYRAIQAKYILTQYNNFLISIIDHHVPPPCHGQGHLPGMSME